MPEPVAIGPGYVANDVEIHTSIVSKHAGPVNANKSPNDEVERRGYVVPRNEADLSQSSTSSLPHRRRAPRLLEPIVMRRKYRDVQNATGACMKTINSRHNPYSLLSIPGTPPTSQKYQAQSQAAIINAIVGP
jgi:hypothetical protein